MQTQMLHSRSPVPLPDTRSPVPARYWMQICVSSTRRPLRHCVQSLHYPFCKLGYSPQKVSKFRQVTCLHSNSDFSNVKSLSQLAQSDSYSFGIRSVTSMQTFSPVAPTRFWRAFSVRTAHVPCKVHRTDITKVRQGAFVEGQIDVFAWGFYLSQYKSPDGVNLEI